MQFASSPHYAEVKDEDGVRIQSVMSEGAGPQGAESAEGAEPIGIQPVTTKDKKKRDKEAKARAKKEKAETKRLLKDQERKIKNEAKQKTETPAERRRKQRRGQEAGGRDQKPAASMIGQLLRSRGQAARNMQPVKVHLLDGTDYDLELEVSSRTHLFVIFMCDSLDHCVSACQTTQPNPAVSANPNPVWSACL